MTNPIASVNLSGQMLKTFWMRFCRCDISSEVHTCYNFWNSQGCALWDCVFLERDWACRVLHSKVFNPKSPILFIRISNIELGILSVHFLTFWQVHPAVYSFPKYTGFQIDLQITPDSIYNRLFSFPLPSFFFFPLSFSVPPSFPSFFPFVSSLFLKIALFWTWWIFDGFL